MKIKSIQDAAFNSVSAAALGFEPLSGTQTLYSHPQLPGLLFKKVANARAAAHCGGVVLVSNGELLLVADPNPKRLLDFNWVPERDLALELKPGEMTSFDGSYAYYAVDTLRLAAKEPLPDSSAPSVAGAMAVVTPCFGIGWVSLSNAGTPTLGTLKAAVGAGDLNASGATVTSTREDYVLLWRELPFVPKAGPYLNGVAGSVCSRYPEDIRDTMVGAFKTIAASAEFDRPAAISFCYLRKGANEWLGHVPMNLYDVKTQSGAVLEAGFMASASQYSMPTKPGVTRGAFAGQYPVPFTSLNKEDFGLVSPGVVKLAVGIPMTEVKESIAVSNGMTLDAAKIVRDFTPLRSDRTFATGVTSWSEVLAAGLVSSTGSTQQPAEYRSYLDAYAEISAPGGPDIVTDLYNASVRAEALVAKEGTNKSGLGAVFATYDWKTMSATKPSTVFSGGVEATRAGSDLQGRLQVETSAEGITITEEGTYRVYVVGRGSRHEAADTTNGFSSARSVAAKMFVFEQRFAKGATMMLTTRPASSVGGVGVVEAVLTYQRGPLRISGNDLAQVAIKNFEVNNPVGFAFHGGYPTADLVVNGVAYGAAATAVAGPGLACVFVERIEGVT